MPRSAAEKQLEQAVGLFTGVKGMEVTLKLPELIIEVPSKKVKLYAEADYFGSDSKKQIGWVVYKNHVMQCYGYNSVPTMRKAFLEAISEEV